VDRLIVWYGKEASESRVQRTPTYLQWQVDLGVDDDRRKHTKKAGSFLALPVILVSWMFSQ